MSFLKIFVNLFHFNRTNWKAVALCFLAATVFWLFNALNKTYSTLLRFPLQFEYDEANYAVAEPLPDVVAVNVSGNGWDLFRKTFGVKLPVLSLPLERPTEVKRIVASSLPPILASQLGNLSINFVATDTLRLHIDRRVKKKFKVYADASLLTYRDDLGRTSPIVVLPDSVALDGPESILRSMNDSLVVILPARRLNNNYRDEVEVSISHSEFIKRNPPVVEVMFEVSELVSVESKIPVAYPRLPWGTAVVQDSITCRVSMPKKDANSFDVSRLRAWVPVKETPQQKGEILAYHPTVQGLPTYATVTHVDSVQIKKH